jgi:Tfp pilus assembly protein PilZ
MAEAPEEVGVERRRSKRTRLSGPSQIILTLKEGEDGEEIRREIEEFLDKKRNQSKPPI